MTFMGIVMGSGHPFHFPALKNPQAGACYNCRSSVDVHFVILIKMPSQLLARSIHNYGSFRMMGKRFFGPQEHQGVPMDIRPHPLSSGHGEGHVESELGN